MAERTTIVGVDFSGDANRNATGYTKGKLLNGNLSIECCERLSGNRESAHEKLVEMLLKIASESSEAVVAIDVPFSVPQVFAIELAQEAKKNPPCTMPDVWEILSGMDENRINELRYAFVGRQDELMRARGHIFRGSVLTSSRWPPSEHVADDVPRHEVAAQAVDIR